MHKMVYFGLGLLFGGGIGATTAYILTKKHERRLCEEEISDMRAHFNQRLDNVLTRYGIVDDEKPHFVTGTSITPSEAVEASVSDDSEPKAYFPGEAEKPSLEALAAAREASDDIRASEGYVDYRKISSGEEEGPTEDTGEGYNAAHPSADTYIISDEQFIRECLNYEKREFRYYNEDSTLCNEEDEVLEDHILIGEKNIDALKNGTDGIIYVRNDFLKIDYEIQLMEGSYNEQVLGMYSED